MKLFPSTPPIIAIENTLVYEDLLDKHFVCGLAACKGEMLHSEGMREFPD